MTPKKKLIEVALPLDAINTAAADEKAVPRRGHPATLHLWWARRPLAVCRAVLFAQLVDDPSSDPERFPTEEAQTAERNRLFAILADLVRWENSSCERVLAAARNEIQRSCNGSLPPVLDPFCGGGSIPLEAQRLGLEAHGTDLNPVAVLITKALIEIPPSFVGLSSISPMAQKRLDRGATSGTRGLAEDVRYYGAWLRAEAEKRIGHLYADITLPGEMGRGRAPVVAWLWARTVTCQNPACGIEVPLVRSFWLSTKKENAAWVEPTIDKKAKRVRFSIRTGGANPWEGTVNRRGATCIACRSSMPLEYVRKEGKAERLGSRLMAIVAGVNGRRVFLAPSPEQEELARVTIPEEAPDTDLPVGALGFRVQSYGITKHRDLFSPRQLLALTTFSSLLSDLRDRIIADTKAAGQHNRDPVAYADAIAIYLAFAIDKMADWSTTLCGLIPGYGKYRNTFSKQTLSMSWDYAELNILGDTVGNWQNHVDWVASYVEVAPAQPRGFADQQDASAGPLAAQKCLISTDPPYYDNIGYGDLSDFFYIWLRATVGRIYPRLFGTVLAPKTAELIANPHRFNGSRTAARQFFEDGLHRAFENVRDAHDPRFPIAIYYAYKQAESESDDSESGDDASFGVASTGWETMLEGLIRSGFQVVGTWPVRTERGARTRSLGSNALASSIVLVCRPRSADAPAATRREFVTALKAELPVALAHLQRGNIAPVDLAQAAIGPGMGVYTRYVTVLDAEGKLLSVQDALGLINQTLDEALADQEGDFDADSRWALAWFEQFGFSEGEFGVAETLSKAKNTSVQGLKDAGILDKKSPGGKVRLLRPAELTAAWDPTTDARLTAWEMVHHLIRVLEDSGESGASVLVAKLGSKAEIARELCYRLYTLCERKKRAVEALSYNGLVQSWPEITRLARETGKAGTEQAKLFESP